MKTKLIPMLAACLLFLSIPIQAQEPLPDKVLEAVQTFLELDDLQLQDLVTLRDNHLLAIEPLKTQIREVQQAQNELLQSDSPDPAAVGGNVLQLRALHQQLREAERSFRESALVLLTDEQKRKVGQVQRALRLVHYARPLSAFGLVRDRGDIAGRSWGR